MPNHLVPHQFIERETSRVITEKLFADKTTNSIYSHVRENTTTLFNLLISVRFSHLLGYLNFDMPLLNRASSIKRTVENLDIDMSECVDPFHLLNTPRKLFERKIRYWETRPMSKKPENIVSPADAKMLVGSFDECNSIFLKEKFFDFNEMIGTDKSEWLNAFQDGDYAVFRLTPEKYHYNHVPVTGKVVDYYEIDGDCHSCNPGAVVVMVTPYSKNRREVTIIDTEIPSGTHIGLVAMIEITALMIGHIDQRYSTHKYENPIKIYRGLHLEKGQPKSLYRPGSSVDVLIFQHNRIQFSPDIVTNMRRPNVVSRYSKNFGQPLVETDVRVRSTIAKRRG
jgi:phosphatidylserine decarboxylase